MANWTIIAKRADFEKNASHFGIDPVVARLIRNRDIVDIADIRSYLHPTFDDMHDPMLLPDMDIAIAKLMEVISSDKRIRIIGDYDVDGVTSGAILVKGLAALKATVDYAIPNRVTDGYGINEQLVRKAIEDGIDCILTCDNGIAAVEPMQLAKDNGIVCIITDHHEVPFTDEGGERRYIYPNADAIVNPKRHDSAYPFRNICGAFVAYKLIAALFEVVTADKAQNVSFADDVNKEELLSELRELAAIGTVCDVMELKDENRALVKLMLPEISHSKNTGIRALLKVCDMEGKSISSFTLGFVIGPCINATGRLDDATISLKLLLCDSLMDAVVQATELKRLNELRKAMTDDGLKYAYEFIENAACKDDKVLVVYVPELHESLAGIVAGRIREKYYKPVFVVTGSEEGLKGSGRSIEGYHMYEEMNKIGDVFTKYGGHDMAAGFSLNEDKLEEFRTRINENCTLTDTDFEEKVKIDVVMPVSYVTEKLIEDVRLLEPFGTGNEKPVFAERNVMFLSASYMGKNKDMARLVFSVDDGKKYEGVIFRHLDSFLECAISKYGQDSVDRLFNGGYIGTSPIRMDIIYNPDINEFRGNKKLQFVINNFK